MQPPASKQIQLDHTNHRQSSCSLVYFVLNKKIFQNIQEHLNDKAWLLYNIMVIA